MLAVYSFFSSHTPPVISSLSLHDALPISALTERLDAFLRRSPRASRLAERLRAETGTRVFDWLDAIVAPEADSWHERLAEVGFRSEEHTSELQSRENIVCRLLLEKKKKD